MAQEDVMFYFDPSVKPSFLRIMYNEILEMKYFKLRISETTHLYKIAS